MPKICSNCFSSFTCLTSLKTNWFDSYMLWYIVRLNQTTWFPTRAAVFEKSWDASNILKRTDIKIKSIFSKQINTSIISLLLEDPAYPSARYGFAPALIFISISLKNSKWQEEGEQFRMLGLPGFLLNNLTSLSLNSYLTLIFAAKRWCNSVKWLQSLFDFLLISGFSWLVYGWFGWFVTSSLVVWLVCTWFVGVLSNLCVVWMVCGWFRVLQLTESVI